MKKKRILLAFISVAFIGGAWFGYSEYNRKVKDLSTVTAEITLQTNELIAAFENNETVANAKYLDKIIAVKGCVKEIEKNDRGHYSIVLGDKAGMSSVRCSMDSVHVKDILMVKEGSVVTVKGACTGFNADELLGSDVILNRCVIEEEK
jgi:DNA polymerase II small subunit/DNA polymerase delta subunit B